MTRRSVSGGWTAARKGRSGYRHRDCRVGIVLKPTANLFGVEPHEVTDLDIGDAPLIDEATEMADAVVEPSAQLLIIEQLGRIGGGWLGDDGHWISRVGRC